MDASAIDNFAGSVNNAKAALEEYLKTERYSAFKDSHEGIDNAEDVYNNAYENLYGGGKSQFMGHTEAIDNVADIRKQISWYNRQLEDVKNEVRELFHGYDDLYGLTAEDVLNRGTGIAE